jgi:hypothetical protein
MKEVNSSTDPRPVTALRVEKYTPPKPMQEKKPEPLKVKTEQ